MQTNRNEAPKRVAQETRRLFGELFSKPVPDLSCFLRPTYKFIEQFVKNLITETGLLRDVFNATDFETGARTQQSADKLKAKRVEFVQKLINYAANNEQPVVGCVAAKLVGGLEPAKCNELLQALARLAQVRLASPQQRSSISGAVRQRTFVRTPPKAAQTSRPQVRPRTQTDAKPQHRADKKEAASPVRLEEPRNSASRTSTGSLSSNASRRKESATAESDLKPAEAALPAKSISQPTMDSAIDSIEEPIRPIIRAASKNNLRDELKNLQTTLANILDLSASIKANLSKARPVETY